MHAKPFLLVILTSSSTLAFPSLAKPAPLQERHLDYLASAVPGVYPLPEPPGPEEYQGTKLVHDVDHPFIAPTFDDIRGPCPGLNTMANHGYIPRSGIASPSQIIAASMEAFNMDNALARFSTYASHILDGNQVTNLVSIGDKTPMTGYDTPHPAIIGGMNHHGTFEGDASLVRGDAFFGDNHNFNETLFDQLKEFSDKYGNGFYNLSVASELRFHRIKESIATNPDFTLRGLRHITSYVEASFPGRMMVDGRNQGTPMEGQLDMGTALSFFRDMRFPKDFHRAATPIDHTPAFDFIAAHPIKPGHNNGEINNYVVDHAFGGLLDICLAYKQFVSVGVKEMYPNPEGLLRMNLRSNLRFFYEALPVKGCTELFPYGKN